MPGVTSAVTGRGLVSGSRFRRCHPASPSMFSCPWDRCTCAAVTQILMVQAEWRDSNDPQNPSVDELRRQDLSLGKKIHKIKCCFRAVSSNCRDVATVVLAVLHPYCRTKCACLSDGLIHHNDPLALEIDSSSTTADTTIRKFLTLPCWSLSFMSCPPVMDRARNLHGCSSLICPGMPSGTRLLF